MELDTYRSKHFLAEDSSSTPKPDVTGEKKPLGERPKEDLRVRILGLLTERALNKVEISKSLGLPAQQRGKLRELLRDMEVGGEVVRIRKDRYIIPADRRSADRADSVPWRRVGTCAR